MTFGGAHCSERLAVGDEEARGAGPELHASSFGVNPSVTLEIQADLSTVGMKTPSPVNRLARLKLMPFEAKTTTGESAGQVLPPSASLGPKGGFSAGGRDRVLNFGRERHRDGRNLGELRFILNQKMCIEES